MTRVNFFVHGEPEAACLQAFNTPVSRLLAARGKVKLEYDELSLA